MSKDFALNNDLKLGILGGGQLGKMLIQSASKWNLYCAILDPTKECPASAYAHDVVVGSFNDYDSVLNFGKDKDVITIEIENVNVEALKKLESMGKKVFPSPQTIEIIKDKGQQKEFYQTHDIPTSAFVLVSDKDEILRRIAKGEIDFPFVQKLRKEGYDGRGVAVIRNEEDLIKLLDKPSVIESMVDIQMELSVILCRNESGEVNFFDVVEMEFSAEANLVDILISPARITDQTKKAAIELGKKVMDAFNMVGVLAVEMFLEKGGNVLVNEVAPRPHNSGHHTIEANVSSQYDQHLRAVLGLPLGHNDLILPAVMINLLGAKGFSGEVNYKNLEEAFKLKGCNVHLYGKKETKAHRKMGHITICGDKLEKMISEAQRLKKTIVVEGQKRH